MDAMAESDHRNSRRVRHVVVICSAIALIVALILVVVGCATDSDIRTGERAPWTPALGDGSDWLEPDWTRAVCDDGFVSQKTTAQFAFPDAMSSAYCLSPFGVDAGRVSIFIAEWESEAAARDNLARKKLFTFFAWVEYRDRVITFAPAAPNAQAVEPLVESGFTITRLP